MNDFAVLNLILFAACCYGIAAQAGYYTPSHKSTLSNQNYGSESASTSPAYDGSAVDQSRDMGSDNINEDGAVSGLSSSQSNNGDDRKNGLVNSSKFGGKTSDENRKNVLGAQNSTGHQSDEAVSGFTSEDELARQWALGSRTNKFPLPSCYINDDGFMCCNKELEKVMNDAYQKISTSRPDWKKCNIAQVSVAVQKAAEKHFNVPLEVVVGAGDYASKNYFSQDLICKIKRDSSYILAFGTPQDL